MPYSLKLLLIGLLTIPTCIFILFMAPFDHYGKLGYSISRYWARAILKLAGIRLKVQGLERLDSTRQYIFIANHQSYLDIPALVQALPTFQLRWIAKKEILWVPLFGWVLWTTKHIIVDRSNLSKAMISLRMARERIEKGISVVVFPEGTRSRNGKLLPFKRGGFLLAIKTQTPIVPVTINGSGTILPREDWRVRSGEIEIVVSDPVPIDQVRAENLKPLLTRVRADMESPLLRQADSRGSGSNCTEALLPARSWGEG
jgi:1-acyl-sn-glycerol-3-phosphate acyltransferase